MYCRHFLPFLFACLSAGSVFAQTGFHNLREAFEAAWRRQPEQHSLSLRRQAADARQQEARTLTAAPAVLEFSSQGEIPGSDRGSRAYSAGAALPLWLPGESELAGRLAQSEAGVLESRIAATQLRIAADIREAWWAWRRQVNERAIAQNRLESAKKLADDVDLRFRAGDLALADRHQAQGAVAQAEMAVAEAEQGIVQTWQALAAMTGVRMPNAAVVDAPEQRPGHTHLPENHALAAQLRLQVQAARQSAELAGIQKRANPELLLSTTREKGGNGDLWQQKLIIGVRLPLEASARHRAKQSLALAEAMESEIALQLEEARLDTQAHFAQARMDVAEQQLAAAERRARLAGETRGFFDKSFRLGESDLPARLRVEQEAMEAQRQLARARIELAAAISALRQALGLLPE